MNKFVLILGCFLCFIMSCQSQDTSLRALTLQDTLRGSVTAERSWWDVTHYNITVKPDFLRKSISGVNLMSCKVLSDGKRMQIDLQEPMRIKSVTCSQKKLQLTRNGNVYYVLFPEMLKKGTNISVRIEFGGIPREAVHPPWDGGWVWTKDALGNPWMSVACQGLGASCWYPCKDYQGDEPDSAMLTMTVPDSLMAISNGRLRNKSSVNDGYISYSWAVTNPINNYNIVPYIGRYVNWSEKYNGLKGNLDCNYWVLQYNELKAKEQFRQVPDMLKCFEQWFGPYPFYEDGYKLVESPYLGMEHQSAVAYGNKFANGYLGKDLSGTGWGKKWDFIIIHESGHEWFGNNITSKDIADEWIHEGFTNYSEILYTTCMYGKDAGNEYCIGLRKNTQNDEPVIGPYGVNREGSIDRYYKAANMIHAIRQIMDDDEKFRQMLTGLNADFFHKTVTSKQIEDYISNKCGRDLSKVFDQYLRTIQIPVLEYKLANGKLTYRWNNCVPGFDMPLRILTDTVTWIYPTTEWKVLNVSADQIQVDPNFYAGSRKL
jgi:aminopeptidase N